LETNAIIYTDRRSYHIRLHSPSKEGDYLNRIAFYYPGKMVVQWKAQEAIRDNNINKETRSNILDFSVSPDKLDFGYRVEGDSDFVPVRVFNDGERTYFEMPQNLHVAENPILYLRDEQDQVMLVNYRVKNDPESGKIHYIVDKLFAVAELKSGSDSVQIFWKKKDKSFWQKAGLGKN
jgi:type IV secretion system protein VirB9